MSDVINVTVYDNIGQKGDTGPANTLTIGTVTTVPVNGSATATITGTSPNQTLSLGIPVGATGPSNVLSIATVTTGAAGSNASATIAGTSPSQTLSLQIPRGDKGETGNTGPSNVLSIGTVTTVPVNGSATAEITGTSPTQTLNLGIPVGATGSWTDAQTLNAQTGITYTLQSSDIGKLVTLTNSSAISVAIDTSVTATSGQRIDLIQMGTGQVTVGGTATLNSTPTKKLRTQYSAATLIFLGAAGWVLVGDLAAS